MTTISRSIPSLSTQNSAVPPSSGCQFAPETGLPLILVTKSPLAKPAFAAGPFSDTAVMRQPRSVVTISAPMPTRVSPDKSAKSACICSGESHWVYSSCTACANARQAARSIVVLSGGVNASFFSVDSTCRAMINGPRPTVYPMPPASKIETKQMEQTSPFCLFIAHPLLQCMRIAWPNMRQKKKRQHLLPLLKILCDYTPCRSTVTRYASGVAAASYACWMSRSGMYLPSKE